VLTVFAQSSTCSRREPAEVPLSVLYRSCRTWDESLEGRRGQAAEDASLPSTLRLQLRGLEELPIFRLIRDM